VAIVTSPMTAGPTSTLAPEPPRRSIVGLYARRVVVNNWKVILYVVLIILCVLFAPEEPLKFIYTEF
jgi:hypothetical protein